MTRPFLSLALALAALLLGGCPGKRDAFREPDPLSGLSRPDFEKSVERWFVALPESDVDAVARCLIFLRDGDPRAALDHPDPKAAVMAREFPSDLRIRLDRLPPSQVVARARRHLRELAGAAAISFRELEIRTAELEDTRARMSGIQEELTAMIDPGSIELVQVEGIPVRRIRFRFLNLRTTPLAHLTVEVTTRMAGSESVVREETSISLDPPVLAGEQRVVERLLERQLADGGASRPTVRVINAFDLAQRPVSTAPDADLDSRIARLRTETATVAARIAELKEALRYPYLNHVMSWSGEK